MTTCYQRLAGACLAGTVFAGCAAKPPELQYPDGQHRVPVRGAPAPAQSVPAPAPDAAAPNNPTVRG